MDAVEYLRQRKRLCDSILENEKYGVDCPHCPLFNEIGLDCCELETRAPESAVRIVSEWDCHAPRRRDALHRVGGNGPWQS